MPRPFQDSYPVPLSRACVLHWRLLRPEPPSARAGIPSPDHGAYRFRSHLVRCQRTSAADTVKGQRRHVAGGRTSDAGSLLRLFQRFSNDDWDLRIQPFGHVLVFAAIETAKPGRLRLPGVFRRRDQRGIGCDFELFRGKVRNDVLHERVRKHAGRDPFPSTTTASPSPGTTEGALPDVENSSHPANGGATPLNEWHRGPDQVADAGRSGAAAPIH